MAIITLFGLFKILRMPFGLKWDMDCAARLAVLVCLLDHLAHLRQLFGWLSEHGLIVNPIIHRFTRPPCHPTGDPTRVGGTW